MEKLCEKVTSTLQVQLTTAWLRKRFDIATMQRSLKIPIDNISEITSEDLSGEHPPEKRTSCYICLFKKGE
nr:unnamed protein product [Callosobruchus chinensis]